MAKRILVAHASKHGATAEIADKIGGILKQEGLEAEVQPVKKVKNAAQYDAFVVGTAAYIGMWRGGATKFLKKNESLLAEKPVWLFSSGPTGDASPEDLSGQRKYPSRLQPLMDAIKPRDVALFHGSIDVSTLNFIEKWMINKVKAPIGDFRNWEVITAWAKGIAAELKK